MIYEVLYEVLADGFVCEFFRIGSTFSVAVDGDAARCYGQVVTPAENDVNVKR